ncbi:hypothetical protein KIW84_034506 [Lathyrus oleraceus]|uniref:Uncharacterized protein n=1 Tax=Pisum sativum TaxID=3888 RepID=A0A9D4Y459_PEA|nr:hypothetical protein KIW84_034506 [Pisum sativum]
MDIPVGQSNESQARLKRGKPISSKDKNPRTRNRAKNKDGLIEDIENLKESSDIINISSLKEIDQVPETHENKEISINFVQNGIQWNQHEIDIDDIFAHNITINEINDKEDHEPMSIKNYRQSEDWAKWKDAIEVELNSLYKRQVFGPIVQTPQGVKKDPFRPREKDEELLGPEIPYLSELGGLMYLANNTRPDISFVVNLLARDNSSPTRRH